MLTLSDLNEREFMLAKLETERREKSGAVAWLLWLFLGLIGGHRCIWGQHGKVC